MDQQSKRALLWGLSCSSPRNMADRATSAADLARAPAAGAAGETDARFEAAAAEERERSAEAAAEEQERSAERGVGAQERERCVAGERAMARVVIDSTFVYQGQQVIVKSKDSSGTSRNKREYSFRCKRPGRRAHESFEAVWILSRQANMANGADLSCDDSVESVDGNEAKGKGGLTRRSARLGGFRSPGRGRDAAIAALGQGVGALGLGGALSGMEAAISARCEEEEGGGGDDGSEYSEGSGDRQYSEGSGDRHPRLTPRIAGRALAGLPQQSLRGATDALLSFLKEHRLADAAGPLRELGAESPADLLDLDDADVAGLGLKELELKRFVRAVDCLSGEQPEGRPAAPPATPESLEARCARERQEAHLRVGLASELGLRGARAPAAAAAGAAAGAGAGAHAPPRAAAPPGGF